jgi:transcriptional regulator with XRE-family HTH domain
VCGSGTDARLPAARPTVPWFAEPVDEEERFAATGWAIGADEEFDEPDVYDRDELVGWGLLPPEPERPPRVPPAGTTVTALVAGALGPLVARHRRLHRWTQETFARRLDLDQPRVSKLEHGRLASLTLARLAELALETGSVVVLEVAPGAVADRPAEERVAGGTTVQADLPDGGKVRLLTVPAAVPATGEGSHPARPVAWAIP